MSQILPREVWLLVAQHLHYEDLEKLMGLNHVFFELAMESRYREVDLVDYEPSQFLRKVEALQSPDVAFRVRTLKLWPSATWEAIYAPPVASKPVKFIQNRIELSRSIFSSVRRSLCHRPSHPQPMQRFSTPPSLDLMSSTDKRLAVTCAAHKLVNVEDSGIHWQRRAGLPKAHHYHYQPRCPLLAAFLPAHGRNLRSLTPDIPSTVLDAFIPSSTSLTSLQELRIKFHVDRGSFGHPAFEASVDPLAPFINGLVHTLKTLSIVTTGPLNLSNFFNALVEFPQLVKLSLAIPFDSRHIHDTSGLRRLLGHHGIRDLTLRSRHCCFIRQRPAFDDVSEWVAQCFRGISFEGLRSLQLGLISPARILPDHIQCMKHISQSLTSLTILNASLSLTVITDVLGALATPSLNNLSLSVATVSLDLFDFLASTCQTLDRLVLEMDRIVLVQGIINDEIDAARFCAMMHDHRNTPEIGMLYDSWRLHDLEIWGCEYGIGRKRQWDLMRSVAQNVPSVFTLWSGDIVDWFIEVIDANTLGDHDVVLRPGSK